MNAIQSIQRAAALAGFVALTVGSSLAHAAGSTDIYGNEFARSLGAPSLQAPLIATAVATGSTDTWKNEFHQSFGPSELASPAALTVVSKADSTDMYSTDFQQVFGTN